MHKTILMMGDTCQYNIFCSPFLFSPFLSLSFLFFLVLVVLRLNSESCALQVLYKLSHTPQPYFALVILGIKVLSICPGWPALRSSYFALPV
jgi:hypothetical protein